MSLNIYMLMFLNLHCVLLKEQEVYELSELDSTSLQKYIYFEKKITNDIY